MKYAWFLIFLSIFAFSILSYGATIRGSIYAWDTLEKINNVIVDINSKPYQRVVAKDGDYSFNVPAGVYKIKASYFLENEPVYEGEEVIKIEEEGEYYLDLILFQSLDVNIEQETLDENTASEIENVTVFEDSSKIAGEKKENYLGIISILAAFLLAGISYYLYKKQIETIRKKKVEYAKKVESKAGETKPAEVKEKKFDKYALDVIELLKRSGSRLTQKEIRERMQLSEAKISLIIAELEDAGVVKKIKKGRGNIIILKELEI